MSPEALSKLRELLEKLAAEIGAARLGSDDGQFAIIDALILLRNAATGEAKLADFHRLAQDSVPWMMSVLESGQPFNAEQIQKLNQIHRQLKEWADQARGEASATASSLGSAAALPEETPLVMNIAADGDILREYVNEAQEHLDNIEQGVLKLEVKPDDAE
ncbi:MAG: hypothetical protein HYY23_05850, partial [Verrucomicrobia bacterium]|nr:hypothetical protein [Verrucomicrobiota bacterium]